jgi:hypothetical protein
MDWVLIITVATFVLQIFAKPLEMFWVKVFEKKAEIVKQVFLVFDFIMSYLLPIVLICYAFYSIPFGKYFVAIVLANALILTINILFRMIITVHKRVKELSAIYEDNKEPHVETQG